MLSSILRKSSDISVYSAALSRLTWPLIDTGENASTAPCRSTVAREPGFDDNPRTLPSSFWIAAEKCGETDRSVKLARPSLMSTFLIAIAIGIAEALWPFSLLGAAASGLADPSARALARATVVS